MRTYIQPKKTPVMKNVTEKLSKEDSPVDKLNSGDTEQKAVAKEPEIIVYLPSCKRRALMLKL